MSGPDVIRINGVPVAINGIYRREVTDDNGTELSEIELVVMIRGRITNKQFIQHMSQDQARVDWDDRGIQVTRYMWITNHVSAGSGEGEGAMYRHDISLREDPSAARARHAAEPKPVPAPKPVAARPQTDDLPQTGTLRISASKDTWGDAIRQLKGEPFRPKRTEIPLSQSELVAIECVLTNLRIDALIDQLDAAGVIRRAAVDGRFHILIEQRFSEEVTPLVGEDIAARALRDLKAPVPQ
jgi:hypothetical protein